MSAAKRFWRTHRFRIAGTVLSLIALSAFAASGRVIVPVAVQFVLDESVLGPGVATVIVLVAVAGATGILVAGLASWAMHRIVVAQSETVFADLRAQVFDHALKLRPEEQDRLTPGAIVSRITSDVDAATQYIGSGGIMLVQNLVQMVLAATVMAIYSWPLALAVILFTLPFVWGMQRVRSAVRKRFAAVRSAVSDVHESVAEVVRGVEVIHAFGVGRIVRERATVAATRVRDTLQRTQYPLHANTTLGEFAGSMTTVIVVIGGALLGVNGGLLGSSPTAGEVVAFLFLTTFFVRPLQFTVTNLGEAQSAVAGLGRSLELLELEVDYRDPDTGASLPAGALDLQTRHLGFQYPDGTRALEHVELRIPFGQFVAVVGATGSGKSTFGRLLTRRLHPTEGRILLGGMDLEALAASALTHRVAVVPQSSFLFDGTIRDNLQLAGDHLTEGDMQEILDELGLHRWSDSLPAGLDTPVGPGGTALSAGERQLVALVRAVLVDPAVLVLDEATSNIDARLDLGVQAAMRAAARGRTTIAIAHRLSTAEHADRILVIDRGRLVEDGDHGTLLAAGGHYARLSQSWMLQKVE